MKKNTSQFHFPKRFLWGAATAAHQVEGGNYNQWSIWELENAKSRATQAKFHYNDLTSWDRIKNDANDPDNYVSGALGDHVHHYEEDFDLLLKMNMNAYRFSIEWSRIEPEEGAWNVEAIAYYRRYLQALKKRDIEPIVTLFHFTLPAWFSAKGGFERRSNVRFFIRFVEKVMHELGKDIRTIITINEPEVYATESYWNQNWPPAVRSRFLWWRVTVNVLYAHREAARLIHKMNRRYRVSIAKNSNYIYAGDNAWLSRVSARLFQYFQDDYFLKKVVKHCDFIGVNYYFSQRVYGYRVHNPNDKVSDVGWDMEPAHLEYTLERLHDKYKLPLLITENGVADATDTYRQWWISQSITAMQNAIDNGVNLEGYLHWSLLDNFEWALGKWPRFGLIEVDYKTKERRIRKSALWFGRVIQHLRS